MADFEITQIGAELQAALDIAEVAQVAPPLAITENRNDWDGVAYADPDAIGANPTAKIYPNGDVVGSTDYGNYTKCANGNFTWNFVHSVTGVTGDVFSPLVSTTLLNTQVSAVSTNSVFRVSVYVNHTDRCQYIKSDNTGVGVVNAIDVNISATGRWKS
jgi:hypothetical protein